MPPITQNSRVALTLGTVIACSIALVGATWKAAGTLSEIQSELAAIRKDMRSQWSYYDQERWAANLERNNRVLNLNVPQVNRVN
jgi:Pyruvate/2-oxoacid:ferredoxin oxidoreductase gamma subunit